ncbi:MAG: sigma-54-dependent Fis family transcriptional regulator, partial [Bacteroidetes bacterium]|nr:sigma-54-dependent Fis family transcriptional regulator [Bacteroidota bacterium]
IRVATTNLTVLITGESGVGKEIFSQIIHQLSSRKHNNFIAVNAGAIPEGTIDSELFGHEKGAFTGATESRKGYFETVNGGSIFLDEVGELPLGTQARLLRMLESGEYIKVGSSQVNKTDVRIIAATNIDLPTLINKGKFREDLYYRMNTVPIKVPSLRERAEDISLLFRKFCVDFADSYHSKPIQLDEEATELLSNYAWPGNIRELKNVAEQVSVLAKNQTVTAEELSGYIPDAVISTVPVTRGGNADGSNFSERELLYSMLFEMKKDINDIKQFMIGVYKPEDFGGDISTAALPMKTLPIDEEKPIVIQSDDSLKGETVEESLSIADKEKELIIKALQRHRGKRKDAASDLGISERTLYRKIKEYDIDG